MHNKNFQLSVLASTLMVLISCTSSDEKTESNVIEWQDKSQEMSLPDGIRFFSGTDTAIGTSIHYLDLDLTNDTLELRAINKAQSQNLTDYTLETGVVAAINGGYFAGNSSYSAVIDDFTYYARNVTSLTRSSKSYPVLRSGLTVTENNNVNVNWIYQFDMTGEVYTFDQPLAYSAFDGTPLPTPEKVNGTTTSPKLVIGGGPTLVKNGQENLTYAEEIFWESGVSLTDLRPRTVVCVTADDHLIMLVTTRYKVSTLPELMISLGCDSAMNLDGGGSTAMAINGQDIYNQNRAVPSALVIVNKSTFRQP